VKVGPSVFGFVGRRSRRGTRFTRSVVEKQRDEIQRCICRM
jgi:hypothetical protein